MTGFLDIRCLYKEEDFESNITIMEQTEGYVVSNLNFARMVTPQDFEASGRMMLEIAKLIKKLNGKMPMPDCNIDGE